MERKIINMETNINCKQDCNLTHNENGKCDGHCTSEILRQVLEEIKIEEQNKK